MGTSTRIVHVECTYKRSLKPVSKLFCVKVQSCLHIGSRNSSISLSELSTDCLCNCQLNKIWYIITILFSIRYEQLKRRDLNKTSASALIMESFPQSCNNIHFCKAVFLFSPCLFYLRSKCKIKQFLKLDQKWQITERFNKSHAWVHRWKLRGKGMNTEHQKSSQKKLLCCECCKKKKGHSWSI